MTISLTATQFLISKICHDLAGPIGAVGAGVEALSEIPGDPSALQLIDETATGLAAKMALFRVVMGHGGQGQLQDAEQLKDLIAGYMQSTGGRVVVHWPDDMEPLISATPTAIRLFALMVLIGMDCLPRGGDLEVTLHPMNPGLGIALSAKHDRAKIRDDVLAAWLAPLDAGEEVLSARNVHVHLARVVAKEITAEVELSENGPGVITLAVVLGSA